MRTLVFGKTGQVAQELSVFEGVTTLGREEADLMYPSDCADLIKSSDADAVINAAAFTAVDAAEADIETARLVNTDAPIAMAQACVGLGKAFVHISTDYVFDGSGNQARIESDPTNPLGVYGSTKLAGEVGVASAGGQYAILRTSWVFSAHGNNFVKTMLRLGADRDALSIVADQLGGPTPAADIANSAYSIAQSLTDGNGQPGIFHYSGIPNVSWADFARTIFQMSGENVDISDILSSEYPTPAKRPLNSRLDCSKISTIYNIQRPDWRDGLRDVLTDLEAK